MQLAVADNYYLNDRQTSVLMHPEKNEESSHDSIKLINDCIKLRTESRLNQVP